MNSFTIGNNSHSNSSSYGNIGQRFFNFMISESELSIGTWIDIGINFFLSLKFICESFKDIDIPPFFLRSSSNGAKCCTILVEANRSKGGNSNKMKLPLFFLLRDDGLMWGGDKLPNLFQSNFRILISDAIFSFDDFKIKNISLVIKYTLCDGNIIVGAS